MQEPLFKPDSTWLPPRVGDLPSWEGAERVSVDVETYDPLLRELGPGPRRGGYICGYSFAIEGGPKHYVPIRHEGGDNVDDPVKAIDYLRHQAERFKGDVVGANLSYDLDFLAQDGVEFKSARFFRDIQIADPLIYELYDSYSLDNISKRHGFAGKEESLLREAAIAYGVDPKSGMWRLPARYVGAYAEADAELPLKVLRRQEAEIERQGIWDIYNLESRVLPVLVKMRRRGVLIDQDKLAQIEQWSRDEEAIALTKVHDLTNVRIEVGDVWRAEAFAPALEAIGVQLERTKTGKPSIRKDILDHLKHPVADALLRARKVNKLRTTFSESIKRHMTHGRIHCEFNQLPVEDDETGGGIKGARFGRLSATHPNLQQQPARDEFASMWRSIYIPDTDLWACMDYSQQEPRWTTHYANIMGLDGATEAARRYHEDPKTDTHDMMTRIIYGDEAVAAMDSVSYKVLRTYCKQIYLGLSYAMGGAKLCRNLGLPTRWCMLAGKPGSQLRLFFPTQEEARREASQHDESRIFEAAGEEGQKILDKFNAGAPFISQLAKKAERQAKKLGFITTVGGRRCRFPVDESGNFDWCHKALNRLIQGSSADQTKTAMVALDAAGYDLQLQVHDEVDTSVDSPEQAEAMAKIMRECIPATVPFRVDVELGPNWGDIH